MAITLRATAVYHSSSTSSATCNKPTGTVDNDIMFAMVCANTSFPSSEPAGWNRVTSSGSYNTLYWKLASSEGANYTWGFASAQKVKVTIISYHGGFDISDPVYSSDYGEYTTSDTICRCGSFTPGNPNSALIVFANAYTTGSVTFTAPSAIDGSSFTEDYDGGSTSPDFYTGIYSTMTHSKCATGNIDVTMSATLTTKYGFSVNLNPDPNGGENRYWVGGTNTWNQNLAGSLWASTSGGAGGASTPNLYDTVYFNSSSGNGTVTFHSTSVSCKELNTSGFTGTLSGTGTCYIYNGNLTMGSGLTNSWTGNIYLYGNANITSNSKTFNSAIYLGSTTYSTSSTSYTLQDALTTSKEIKLNIGIFDTNDKNVSCLSFSSNNSNTRTLTIENSTITITGVTGTLWDISTTTGLTLNKNSSLILLNGTLTSDIKFIGGSLTYNNIEISTSGSYYVAITGSNTFNNFKVSGGVNLKMQDSSTTTVSTTDIKGTSDNKIILRNLNDDGSVLTFTKIASGSGYPLSDVTITLVGGNNDCTLKRSSFGTLTLLTAGSGYTAGVTYNTTSSGTGSGLTIRADTVTSKSVWNIVDTSGINSIEYCDISYSTASGGAVWNAFTSNGNNNGDNNTGWNFNNTQGSFLFNMI